MSLIFKSAIGLFVAVGLFLFITQDQEITISSHEVYQYRELAGAKDALIIPDYEARLTPSAIDEPVIIYGSASSYDDIEPQDQLKDPPDIIKAIYSTSWSASSDKRLNYFFDLIKNTEINSVVIDIKDYSGFVSYDSDIDLVKKYNAKQVRIPRLNKLIKAFHDEGVYVIARLSVFQDPILTKARPDLAVLSSSTNDVWYDYKGLSWADPSSKEVWDYNIAIAKEAAARGFDEINFDYIRFPSDGDLSDMVFTHWDKTFKKHEVIRIFFEYLHNEMGSVDVAISADLFGLTTARKDDLGIGQILEDALPHFDFIAPMIYPSHYAKSFLGFEKPAEHPYEVIKYSMDKALKRVAEMENLIGVNHTESKGEVDGVSESDDSSQDVSDDLGSSETDENEYHSDMTIARIRPWIQDFDLGADYDKDMVRAQIEAVYKSYCDILGSNLSDKNTPVVSSTVGDYANINVPCEAQIGWMLWNPRNVYTEEALIKTN